MFFFLSFIAEQTYNRNRYLFASQISYAWKCLASLPLKLRNSSTAIVEVVHCNCTSIRVVPPPLLRKASTASPQIHFCKNSSLSRRVSIIARSRVLRCCYTGLPPLLQNSTTNILQPRVRRHFCESPSSFLHESVINFA